MTGSPLMSFGLNRPTYFFEHMHFLVLSDCPAGRKDKTLLAADHLLNHLTDFRFTFYATLYFYPEHFGGKHRTFHFTTFI